MTQFLQIITRCAYCGYGFRAKMRDGSLFEPEPKSYCAICPECGATSGIMKFVMLSYDEDTGDLLGTTL